MKVLALYTYYNESGQECQGEHMERLAILPSNGHTLTLLDHLVYGELLAARQWTQDPAGGFGVSRELTGVLIQESVKHGDARDREVLHRPGGYRLLGPIRESGRGYFPCVDRRIMSQLEGCLLAGVCSTNDWDVGSDLWVCPHDQVWC